MGTLRKIAFAIVIAAVLALLYPLKIFIPGVAWNALPPLAWKAIPRFVCDARTTPMRTVAVDDKEAVRFLFWGFLTTHRGGWTFDRTVYPVGVLVIADTARLNLLPERNLVVFLYRGPTGAGIQLTHPLAPGEAAKLAAETVGAVSAR
jgi:hypothetical protein